MRTVQPLLLALMCVVLLIAGCKPNATNQGSAAEYDIRGKVVAVDTTKQTVTLDHETIPGYMKGMTMTFDVEDPKLLTGLQAGDPVQGKLKKTDSGPVVTRLEKR
jgi:Cu/Ag efflux protein CusF